MKLDAFLTPLFPEKETQFEDSIIVMMDVLRASTTVCAAVFNGAREVIPADTPDKAVHVFSGLSREIRFLGGERNNIKPNGFDAGNSPLEYKTEAVQGKTVIITTTNGTKIFQKAKNARARIVAGFVNFSPVLDYIINEARAVNNEISVYFFCAGNEGRISYEDTLCAGAFINALQKMNLVTSMTDSAFAANDLYEIHAKDMQEFLKTRDHAQKLLNLGFEEDINTALSYDVYPVIPVIIGGSIKKLEK